MMKIVQINATCGIGSTGKICVGISELLTEKGVENYIICSRSNGYPLGIECANNYYTKLQAFKAKVLGNYGFNSVIETKKIIAELEKIKPDIVHLHNIHGHDCNLAMLFKYFKKNNTKLIWTCHDCPQRQVYSFFFDKSKQLFNRKKELFAGLNLTVVTPSQWLADLVKQSFLKDYPVEVINNGIDLGVFNPTESDFRKKHGIDDKKIILDVAFDWDARKGLDVFLELDKRLSDDYKIVLVGTNDETDKRLPESIISIHRTQNQQELAEIYSAADVFVNPTREDNYPTVNMESIACGTPVITFKTGGSPEMVDGTSGSVVECDDIDALEREIIRVCEDKPYSKENCIARAQEFAKAKRFQEYVDLYDRVLNKNRGYPHVERF